MLGELRVHGVAGDDRRRSARCARRPWGAARGRVAGPPPGGSRTCRTPGWRPRPRAGRWRSSRPWRRPAAPISPLRNASKSRCRSLTGVSPLMTGASRSAPSSSSWSRYCPITRIGSPACWATSGSTTRVFAVGAGGQAVALLGLGGRVGQPLGLRQRHAHLDAVGRRDPALRLDVLPRRVVALRPDQREHVALAAVLAHQRRGEAEPPRACRSAVIRKIGAGSRCTSS